MPDLEQGFKVELPDGSGLVEFGPGYTATEAENKIKEDFGQDVIIDTSDPDDSEFSKGLLAGWDNVRSIVGAAVQGAGEELDIDALADWGAATFQEYQRNAARRGVKVHSFEQVINSEDQFNDFLNYASSKIGEGLATSAVPLAVAAAAATISLATPFAAGAAAGAGFLGGSYLIGVGDIYGNQLSDKEISPEERSYGTALIGAAPYALLERVGMGGFALKVLGKGIAAKTFTGKVAKGATEALIGEATAEAGQEIVATGATDLVRGGKGDTTSEAARTEAMQQFQTWERWKQIGEAGIAGGIAGGTIGGIGSVFAKRQTEEGGDDGPDDIVAPVNETPPASGPAVEELLKLPDYTPEGHKRRTIIEGLVGKGFTEAQAEQQYFALSAVNADPLEFAVVRRNDTPVSVKVPETRYGDLLRWFREVNRAVLAEGDPARHSLDLMRGLLAKDFGIAPELIYEFASDFNAYVARKAKKFESGSGEISIPEKYQPETAYKTVKLEDTEYEGLRKAGLKGIQFRANNNVRIPLRRWASMQRAIQQFRNGETPTVESPATYLWENHRKAAANSIARTISEKRPVTTPEFDSAARAAGFEPTQVFNELLQNRGYPFNINPEETVTDFEGGSKTLKTPYTREEWARDQQPELGRALNTEYIERMNTLRGEDGTLDAELEQRVQHIKEVRDLIKLQNTDRDSRAFLSKIFDRATRLFVPKGVKTQLNTEEELEKLWKSLGGADLARPDLKNTLGGLYSLKERSEILSVALQAPESLFSTTAHEAFHAIQQRLTNEEKLTLRKGYSLLRKIVVDYAGEDYVNMLETDPQFLTDIRNRRVAPDRVHNHVEIQAMAAEALAHEMLNPESYSKKHKVSAVATLTPALIRIFRKVFNFIFDIKAGLAGENITDVQDIYTKFIRGDFAERALGSADPNISNQVNASIAYFPSTEQWRNWFRDSILRNPDGTPRVLFHGTTSKEDFSEFTLGKGLAPGIHIGTLQQATSIINPNHLAKFKQPAWMGGWTEYSRIVPLFARAERPFFIHDLAGWEPMDMLWHMSEMSQIDMFRKTGKYIDSSDRGKAQTPIFSFKEAEQLFTKIKKALGNRYDVLGSDYTGAKKAYDVIFDAMKSKGYDSFAYENDVEGEGYSYILIDPQQAKSVWNTHPTESSLIDGRRFSVKEEVDRGWQNVKDMWSSDLDSTHKDIGRLSATFESQRSIAKRVPLFGPVFNRVIDILRERMLVAQDMARNIATGEARLAAFAELEPQEQERVWAAIEVLSAAGIKNIPQENGRYVLRYNDELKKAIREHSGRPPSPDFVINSLPSDVIELTDREARAVDRMRQGNSFLVNKLLEALLHNYGLDTNNVDAAAEEARRRREEAKNLMESEDKEEAAEGKQKYEELQAFFTHLSTLQDMLGRDYLPRIRFGDRAIAIKQRLTDKNGKEVWRLVHLETFETKKFGWKQEARERITDLEKKFRGQDFRWVGKDSPFVLTKNRILQEAQRDNSWHTILNFEQLVNILFSNGKTPHAKEIQEQMRKELTKVAALTGFARHLQHPQYVTGYSKDMKRAVGSYIASASNYAAKVRYMKELTEAVSEIDAQAYPNLRKMAEDQVDYISSHREEFSWMRNLGFTWYLGLNPASAALQFMTIPTFTLPVFTSFTSMPRASAALLNNLRRAAAIFKTKGLQETPLEISNFKGLSEANKKRLIRAWEQGLLKPLLTLEQLGFDPLESTVAGKAGTQKYRQGLHMASYMFNLAEATGRVGAFAAAIEVLETDPNALQHWRNSRKGDKLWQTTMKDNSDEIYAAAAHIIDDSFGIYGKGNKPKYMRDWRSPIFQFNEYPQFMIELMIHSMRNSFGKDASPETRRAAAMMFLMLFLVAGAHGLPGAEDFKDMVESLYNAAFKDNLNIDREVREFIAEASDSNLVAEMFSRGAVDSLIGGGIGRRTSLGNIPALDIFFATVGIKGDVRDALGVPGSMILDSARQFGERYHTYGFVDAFAESLAPTAFKNIYQAFKWNYSGQGVRSRTNRLVVGHDTEQPELLRALDTLKKAAGFTPQDITRAREADYASRTAGPASDKLSSWYKRYANVLVEKAAAAREGDLARVRELDEEIAGLRREIVVYNKGRPIEEKLRPTKAGIKLAYRAASQPVGVRKPAVPKHARKAARKVESIYLVE